MTKQGWPAVCDVLIRGAVQHEQLDFVAAALMERARRHEHVPVLAAQAAKVAEERYNSTQLVSQSTVVLLAERWGWGARGCMYCVESTCKGGKG